MGGERASITRQRERGQICCNCHRLLDVPPWGMHLAERYCDRCAPLRRVYMYFFQREGWVVQFLEPDLRTSIGRGRTFADPCKIRELIARTPTTLTEAEQYKLEHDLANGRGSVYLSLTQAQYGKLWR